VLCVKYKKYIGVFVFYVLFMTIVSAFLTREFFEVDYKFGQQDLIEFANYAKEKDYTISTFGIDRKYSLLYYNDEIMDYHIGGIIDLSVLKEDLERGDNIVIMQTKRLPKIEKVLKFEIIKTGRRYSMIKGLNW
jgi:hypothetical protein